ncbi:acid phosphatase AphA [Vibrio mangrovi]|uniref:Class B acid phosphatase n=1 Tax=Vibrio mangrovi TaxID=474394 RepID=A0A1Y6IQ29_9VIBR|nr:acid phosphatase AphA [Vibrio mangrovi]MDW6004031.1 acid phosphatase AphA [Vibrio mangrovi]SMR99171.1 Class B acid phosphatase precursor [Vibrio mangrovi]
MMQSIQKNKSELIGVLTLVTSCLIFSVQADPKMPGTEPGLSSVDMIKQSQSGPLKWVSVDELRQELGKKPPMAVGFDIDDTVLFSSPGFYHGKAVFSPNGYSYLKNQKFWDKMNCEWEVFSMPKTSAKALIAMHQARGDDIYFITGRTGSACEITTDYIQKTFSIQNMHPVIFAGSSRTEYTKTAYIKQHQIKIYYGDSDGDIISARQGGAEGIRVIRSANSSYQPVPKNGIYGERIVRDSQY